MSYADQKLMYIVDGESHWVNEWRESDDELTSEELYQEVYPDGDGPRDLRGFRFTDYGWYVIGKPCYRAYVCTFRELAEQLLREGRSAEDILKDDFQGPLHWDKAMWEILKEKGLIPKRRFRVNVNWKIVQYKEAEYDVDAYTREEAERLAYDLWNNTEEEPQNGRLMEYEVTHIHEVEP